MTQTETPGEADPPLATVSPMDASPPAIGDLADGQFADEAAFRQLVVNALLSNVAGTFLWFALTFWVYLETQSVVATGVIGGSFGLASAALGPWFGTYVDHHRKHAAMMLATSVSTGCFAVAALVYALVDTGPLLELGLALVLAAGAVDAGRIGRRHGPQRGPVDLRDDARARPTGATRPTAWSARSPASASPSPRCSAGSPSAWPAWGGR